MFNFTVKEFILGNGTGTPTLQFYKRGFDLGAGTSPTWQDIILSGNTALTLTNAKADGLNYLKLFGGTEQRNLPSGYTQLDSITSDGTSYINTGIKSGSDVKAEFMVDRPISPASGSVWVPLGTALDTSGQYSIFESTNSGGDKYVALTYGAVSGSEVSADAGTTAVSKSVFTLNNGILNFDTNSIITSPQSGSTFATNNDIWLFLRPNTSNGVAVKMYYCKLWKAGVLVRNLIPCKNSDNNIGMYDTVSGVFFTTNIGTFTAGNAATPTPSTPIDIVSNNGVVRASINEFDANAITSGYFYNAELEWVANSSVYTTDYMKTVKGKYTLVLSNVTTLSSTVNVRVNLFDSNKDIQSQTVIPIESDTTEYTYEINIPDGISYVRISTNPMYVVVSNFNNSKTIYTDGTVETVEVDTTGDTATAEMLLKVGDYQDVQSIIDGSVNRQLGVMVLTGAEEGWNYYDVQKIFYCNTLKFKRDNTYAGICTHYTGKDYSQIADLTLDNVVFTSYISTTEGVFAFRDLRFNNSTMSLWKAWLADQYAAGTPVMVVYPLATPTTESVTPQPLSIQAGTNTVEITQASINNLPLEVSYKGTV